MTIGGHNGGNVASGLAVEVIANGLMELRPDDWYDEDIVVEAMKQAAFNANDHILRRAHEDPSYLIWAQLWLPAPLPMNE